MPGHYRVAIIGLSDIAAGKARTAPHPALGGATPYSHASAYARVPGCEVVAACDVNPASRERFLTNWGSTWPGARLYDDAEEMLAKETPDIVSVATPDHLHADFVVRACELGAKAILCEKPLATTLADCDRMIAAVNAHNVKMNVDHTRRWLGTWWDAKAAIKAGAIGEVRQVIGFLGGPRAMLFRNGTHVVDLINFFAEGTPVWVSGEIEEGFDHLRNGFVESNAHDPNSEPGANAQIGYDNGVRGTYLGMKGALADVGATVIGSEGRIEISRVAERIVVTTKDGLAERPLYLDPIGFRGEYETPGIAGAVADLIRAVETGGPTISPPEEARKAVAVLQGILRSHFLQGRRVRVPGPGEDYPPIPEA